MPSKSAGAALRDMLHHIEFVATFVAGIDDDAFHRDMRAIYAVTRCLEIISEASRRVPAHSKARHPSIDWRRMAAAGVVYRHDYEDVASQDAWNTVHIDLPPLRAVIERELSLLG